MDFFVFSSCWSILFLRSFNCRRSFSGPGSLLLGRRVAIGCPNINSAGDFKLVSIGVALIFKRAFCRSPPPWRDFLTTAFRCRTCRSMNRDQTTGAGSVYGFTWSMEIQHIRDAVCEHGMGISSRHSCLGTYRINQKLLVIVELNSSKNANSLLG